MVKLSPRQLYWIDVLPDGSSMKNVFISTKFFPNSGFLLPSASHPVNVFIEGSADLTALVAVLASLPTLSKASCEHASV